MTKRDIKMVAVDVDGTFVRSDYTYDAPRFKRILARMKKAGCEFVIASGNQYYQLRDLFPDCCDELSYVAENGAFVKAHTELVFAAEIPRETVDFVVDLCAEYPEISNVLCGLNSAYCQRGAVSQDFFEFIKIYCHRLAYTEDFKKVDDRILKFALSVPEEKTAYYYDVLRRRLNGRMDPTTSGHGSIDLIVPGCHKASGLKHLVKRWGITPDQCAAFGDGGNDIEMLKYCGLSYAMANAPDQVKSAASGVCPSNDGDGVLITLDRLFPENPRQ